LVEALDRSKGSCWVVGGFLQKKSDVLKQSPELPAVACQVLRSLGKEMAAGEDPMLGSV